MAIKLLWLKPDKYYVTWKGSCLTSAQSSITGLYSVRYSPLHIINSWLYCLVLNVGSGKHRQILLKLINKNIGGNLTSFTNEVASLDKTSANRHPTLLV